MRYMKTLCSASVLVLLAACADTKNEEAVPLDTASQDSKAAKSSTIKFIAFGDGGYNPTYPKTKNLKKALTKEQFIEAERKDWIEEGRPEDEFSHAPLTLYPNTNIAAEASGAHPVGTAMATYCKTDECEFAIQLGDNIYPNGADDNDGRDDQKRMNDLILDPIKPLLVEEPGLIVYSALGNHDWKSSRKGVAMQLDWMEEQPKFTLPKPGYYNYKMGEPGNDIEFFVLDTNLLLTGQTIYEVPLLADGSEQPNQVAIDTGTAELDEAEPHEIPLHGEDVKQLEWLKDGLKNSTAKWKLVYGHHILWSIGGSKYDEGHVLRRLIMPTLCKYSDGYIAGHEHDLEAMTDTCEKYFGKGNINKLPLIITGAASKMRGHHSGLARYQEEAYPQFDLLWNKSFAWGFAHITVDNNADSLAVKFFTTPNDRSGDLVPETELTFPRRSHESVKLDIIDYNIDEKNSDALK